MGTAAPLTQTEVAERVHSAFGETQQQPEVERALAEIVLKGLRYGKITKIADADGVPQLSVRGQGNQVEVSRAIAKNPSLCPIAGTLPLTELFGDSGRGLSLQLKKELLEVRLCRETEAVIREALIMARKRAGVPNPKEEIDDVIVQTLLKLTKTARTNGRAIRWAVVEADDGSLIPKLYPSCSLGSFIEYLTKTGPAAFRASEVLDSIPFIELMVNPKQARRVLEEIQKDRQAIRQTPRELRAKIEAERKELKMGGDIGAGGPYSRRAGGGFLRVNKDDYSGG
jgi:hypothetical protein